MVTWRSGPAPSKMTFDAWGELLAQTGSEGVAYTYTGQEWDEESNMRLFYLRNRYYDPSLGRFLTPDPLVSDLNPYSYCNNNPVMMSDPLGLNPKPGEPAPGDPDYVDPNYKPGPYDGLFTAVFRGGFTFGPSVRQIMRAGCQTKFVDLGNVRKTIADQVRRKYDEKAGGKGKWTPDADGKITALEAWVWYQVGDGQAQSVALSSLDLSGVSQSDFDGVGDKEHFDLLLNPLDTGVGIDGANTGYVFGGLNLTLEAGGVVSAVGGGDMYDFDFNSMRSVGSLSDLWYDIEVAARNVAVIPANLFHGNGTPFWISLIGTAAVKE